MVDWHMMCCFPCGFSYVYILIQILCIFQCFYFALQIIFGSHIVSYTIGVCPCYIPLKGLLVILFLSNLSWDKYIEGAQDMENVSHCKEAKLIWSESASCVGITSAWHFTVYRALDIIWLYHLWVSCLTNLDWDISDIFYCYIYGH